MPRQDNARSSRSEVNEESYPLFYSSRVITLEANKDTPMAISDDTRWSMPHPAELTDRYEVLR